MPTQTTHVNQTSTWLSTRRLDADQDQGVRHSWPQLSTGRWRYDPYYCQPFPYWSGQPLPSRTASGMEPNSKVLPKALLYPVVVLQNLMTLTKEGLGLSRLDSSEHYLEVYGCVCVLEYYLAVSSYFHFTSLACLCRWSTHTGLK